MGKKLNRAGLRQEKIQTKKGLRTYWVKAGAAVKRVGATLNKHKGKIAAGAALAAGAYAAVRHGSKVAGAFKGAREGHKFMKGIHQALPGGETHSRSEKAEKGIGILGGAIKGFREGRDRDNARASQISGFASNMAGLPRTAAIAAGGGIRRTVATVGTAVGAGVRQPVLAAGLTGQAARAGLSAVGKRIRSAVSRKKD